jgi:hypothetical protein
MSTIQAFFFIGIYYFYFISNNNCRLLTTVQVFDIMFDTPLRHLVSARNDERMNSQLFFKYFYARIVQSNLCWKIHNKYVSHVIHIFVLKYLVPIQIIQNQLKISEGGKWNSHQMPCVYSSRMVKNYRICPIRIEIIHGRHRVVQIYTWAGPFYS